VRDAGGVYFRLEDYASVWRRLLVDLIDALVVSIVCFILTLALWAIFPLNKMTLNLTLAAIVVVAFYYLVVLKRSSIRTIGYRVGGVRIVGLDGKIASVPALTLRLLFAPLGPLNWFVDLAWISSDTHRQSLRDKLAHTYVVMANAQPAGTDRILYRYYDILGYSFLFQEVDVGTKLEPSVRRGISSAAGT
jgi:uncharacterized RDD family membrane protein YckC